MSKSTNKFGVPYHSYCLYLECKGWTDFEMACQEDWGNVSDIAMVEHDGTFHDTPFVGFGNDEDGYYKITNVYDYEIEDYISPAEFAERCNSYVANYSE